MKKFLIVAAALAMSVSAAEAVCTKKSLNGNWSLGLAGGSPAAPGTASGGNFTFTNGGSTLTMSITSFNTTKCKGSGNGVSNGTPFTFTLNTERIPGSSQKPNHVFVEIILGGLLQAATLARQ